jgi:hypothetical protein
LQHGGQQVVQQQQPLRWYKYNVDAGFHKELNKTSFDWCLRDYKGRFVMAASYWLDGNCSIVEGESIALLEVLNFMKQRGVSHVIF